MTATKSFSIRFADEHDAKLIFDFIRALAEYEHLSDQVTATPELLRKTIFEDGGAEVVIAEVGEIPVGFALFFHNYSTFLGRPGLYIEDLFVLPEYRGMGIGSAFFTFLAKTAIERGCGRMEWSCLDWNEPALEFYRARGAVPMSDWTVQRVDSEGLKILAGGGAVSFD